MRTESKYRLFTPGPTPVPDQMLLELARPVQYHRSPESRAIFGEVLDGLRHVLQTSGDVLVLTSSGTGAMEAAVVNTLRPGATALVLEAGRFAQRWSEICRAHGAEVVTLDLPWGQAVEPEAVAAKLRETPNVEVVFGTLCETSTGAAHDVEGIAAVVRESDALFAVDGISGAGAVECRTEAWGIDLLVTGSQKALMLPPGLAFAALSDAAWARIEQVAPRAYYFDLRRYREKLSIPDTPFTPAHTLIRALAVALRQIRETGIEQIWARTARLAAACRAGVAAMRLEVFATRPAPALTAVRVPEGIDGVELLRRLKERFNVVPAGGQDRLKGKIFRIAHMGAIDELDLLSALAAIEMVLHEFGHPVDLGAAVAAAERALVNA
jgi:aspartate aminotransferase-like enzyme